MDIKQNADFQAIVSLITSLELKLKDVEQVQLQDFIAMKLQIEEHFDKCSKVLVDRKNSLINQINDVAQKRGTSLSKTKEDLRVCIESCKDVQEVGIRAFKTRPSIAAQIWRGALTLEVPASTTDNICISIDLPNTLEEAIYKHGKGMKLTTNDRPEQSTVITTTTNIEALDSTQSSSELFIRTKDIQEIFDQEKDLADFINSSSYSSSSSESSSLSTNLSNELSTVPVFSNLPATSTNNPSFMGPGVSLHPILDNFAEATTLAGLQKGFRDGKGMNVQFCTPCGISFNPRDECFYISDTGNKAIRRMTLQGDVTTLVQVKWTPVEIAVYHKENVLFAICAHTILKITLHDEVTVFAGDPNQNKGLKDGVGFDAKFNNPSGITIDQETGTIYVCDSYNHVIRKITQKRGVATITGSFRGYMDANSENSRFDCPTGICFNATDRSLLVCDFGNNRIRQVASNGDVSTVCKMYEPRRMAMTSDGKLLVSSDQNKIFQIVKRGIKYESKFLAGSGKLETVDSKSPIECSFNLPSCIAVHEPSNSCFITECDGHVVRRIKFN